MYPVPRNQREKSLRKRIKQFYIFNLILGYMLISAVIFIIINKIQPAPFIDEVFHVPQAISYIKGNFSDWNPKITTLPGLYLVTSLIFNVISFVADVPMELLCHTYYLRLFNLVLSIFTLHVIYSILTFDDFSTRKVLKPRKAFWVTLNVSFLPVSYLFNHFYYTDTFSTLLVLMMYRQHLLDNFGKAAVLGILAVMVRQTNVIWVGYLMIDEAFQLCQQILRKRKDHYLIHPLRAFRKLLDENLLKTYMTHLFKNSRFYILVCIMFIVFVFVNNGIVVGDKDAHVPVFHLCQLFYFSLFIVTFAFPHFTSSLKPFLNHVIENKVIAFISIIFCSSIIYLNTMAHPYLLADNRHYTFYFWKRIYENHFLIKYLLVPFYIFGIYSITNNLDQYRLVQFWVCTCLCLVPQRLLELRYFIIPYLMLRLEISYDNSWSTAVESFWFILINCLSIYIFVTKQFYWPDSPEIQRIIW